MLEHVRHVEQIGEELIVTSDGRPVPREVCFTPLNLTLTEAAAALDVSRNRLSAMLNGRAVISPEMAVRLSIAFDTTTDSWLHQQMQCDLWHAERSRKRLRVRKLAGRVGHIRERGHNLAVLAPYPLGPLPSHASLFTFPDADGVPYRAVSILFLLERSSRASACPCGARRRRGQVLAQASSAPLERWISERGTETRHRVG